MLVVEVVLWNPKWQSPFWLKAKALILESCPETTPQITQARRYMQDEEDQLLHGQLIRSVVAWTRWWCLTSKALVLVFKKKTWGVIGAFLRQEKHYTVQTCVLRY